MKKQLLIIAFGFSMTCNAASTIKPQQPTMARTEVSEIVRLTSDFGITIGKMAYKDITRYTDKICVQACCYLFGNMIDRKLQPYIGKQNRKKDK